MCGKTFVAPPHHDSIFRDTGLQGFLCRCVFVLEKLNIKNALYIKISLDRKRECPVITYSNHGGMHLREIEKFYPEDLNQIYVDIEKNLSMGDLLGVASDLGIERQKS